MSRMEEQVKMDCTVEPSLWLPCQAHTNRAGFFHCCVLFKTVSISVLSTPYSNSEHTERLLYVPAE